MMLGSPFWSKLLFPGADTNTDCKSCKIEQKAMQELTPHSSLYDHRIHSTDEPSKTVWGKATITSVMSSLTTNTLCERCKTLPSRILKLVDTSYPGSEEILGFITKRSICAGCSLCFQFTCVFEHLESLTADDNLEHFVLYWFSHPQFQRYIQVDCVRGNYDFLFFPAQNVKHGGLSPPIRQKICPVHPDYDFIRAQLDICKVGHGQECNPSMTGKHTLRVIDCRSRRLTTVNPDEPYICLSYVWGSGNMQDAREFGDKLPASVPKTVEDAMFVAITLGIPYLWVDRYCIDQGNHEEKHRIIQNMNRIYEQAEVTIIAAIGDDPNHGLPGVRGTLRERPLTLEIGGATFVSVEDTTNEIMKTKWWSRGWTYQEMLLSRRRLVFTKTQMYLQCRKIYCMETLHPDFTASDTEPFPTYQCFPSQGIGQSIVDLSSRLEEYYQRELSFDTDSILAFDGIINAFDELKSFPFRVKQFYGVLLLYCDEDKDMVQKSFISNLGWYLLTYGYTASDGGGETIVFPSWSWASAKASHLGGILYHSHPPTKLVFHDDIEVRLESKGGRKLDLHEFFENTESHELFLPSIEITTWVHDYPFEWTLEDSSALRECSLHFDFKPRDNCHTLHMVYLGACTGWDVPNNMDALIVEELRPGIFRRIGLWHPNFGNDEFATWRTAYNMLTRMLEELKKKIRSEFRIPGQEVLLPDIKWEKMTLTIV